MAAVQTMGLVNMEVKFEFDDKHHENRVSLSSPSHSSHPNLSLTTSRSPLPGIISDNCSPNPYSSHDVLNSATFSTSSASSTFGPNTPTDSHFSPLATSNSTAAGSISATTSSTMGPLVLDTSNMPPAMAFELSSSNPVQYYHHPEAPKQMPQITYSDGSVYENLPLTPRRNNSIVSINESHQEYTHHPMDMSMNQAPSHMSMYSMHQSSDAKSPAFLTPHSQGSPMSTTPSSNMTVSMIDMFPYKQHSDNAYVDSSRPPSPGDRHMYVPQLSSNDASATPRHASFSMQRPLESVSGNANFTNAQNPNASSQPWNLARRKAMIANNRAKTQTYREASQLSVPLPAQNPAYLSSEAETHSPTSPSFHTSSQQHQPQPYQMHYPGLPHPMAGQQQYHYPALPPPPPHMMNAMYGAPLPPPASNLNGGVVPGIIGTVPSSNTHQGNRSGSSNYGLDVERIERGKFPCSYDNCGKSFKRQEHLKRHIATSHNPQLEYKVCKYCSSGQRKFAAPRIDNYRQHIRLHATPNKTTQSRVEYRPEALIELQQIEATMKRRAPNRRKA